VADPKQIEILSSGADMWNVWREQNPEVVEPDLSQEAPYFGPCESLLVTRRPQINLMGSTHAGLSGVNLYRAKMRWTAFYYADFTNATFAGGDLSEATIIESNLSQANLNGVNLTNANLQRSKFVSADLSGAICVVAI